MGRGPAISATKNNCRALIRNRTPPPLFPEQALLHFFQSPHQKYSLTKSQAGSTGTGPTGLTRTRQTTVMDSLLARRMIHSF